jgi:hypothetical protein
MESQFACEIRFATSWKNISAVWENSLASQMDSPNVRAPAAKGLRFP